VGLLRVDASLRDGALDPEGSRVALLGPARVWVWDLDAGEVVARPAPGRWRTVAWVEAGGLALGGDHGRVELRGPGGVVRRSLDAGGGKVTRLATGPGLVAATVADYMNTAYLSRLVSLRVQAWDSKSGAVRLDEVLEDEEALSRFGLHRPGSDAAVDLVVARDRCVWARRWTGEGPVVTDVTHGTSRAAEAFPGAVPPLFDDFHVRELGLAPGDRAVPLRVEEELGREVGAAGDQVVTPDGRLEVAAGEAWRLALRDLRRGVVKQVRGQHAPVTRIAVSRDGARLASAGADGEVLVWDLPELRRRVGLG
jgi:WD40 repeat protein